MKVLSKLVVPLLFLSTIALLTVPVVYTTPPSAGIGTFDQSIPDPNVEPRPAGKNMIVHQWGGGGYLYGILEGKWIHNQWMIVHPSGMATIKGVWDTPGGVTLHTPNGDLFGTIHVRYWGKVDTATGVMQGKWVIISGTDDLANLRGQGTVWADPISGGGYTVQYHFDPS